MDATQALAVTSRLYSELVSRRGDIDTFDDYYAGNQPLKFASREWSEFHKDRYKGFADNWCGVVPDAANERVRVSGIRVSSGGQSDAERRLWDAWQRAGLDAKSSQGFLQSMISGRSAVLVWASSNGVPLVTWEHPGQMIVDHDVETGARRYALKSWTDDGVEFATLYTPTEVWKWKRKASREVAPDGTVGGLHIPASLVESLNGKWEPREVDDRWPLKNPFGEVPVVEIPNRPRLKHGPLSDIAGVAAMQDAINLLWAFLFGAADHASLPARVVMGQEPPKMPVLDKDGQKVGERPVPIDELQKGRILWLTGQNASIGQWDAAKLEVFTDVIQIGIGHISSQVRVPAHYFVANTGLSNINGETLTATETPLVKKVGEFQLYVSEPVADVQRLIAMVIDEPGLGDALTAESTQWANPAINSDAQMADALQKKKSIGYPMRYLLELDGLSPTEQDRVMGMIREEQSDPEMQLAASLLNGGTGATAG